MPDSPLIAVLLPTYEPNPDYLRQALDSLMNQTEKRWSLFIHDDASTRDVEAMAESYLRDHRITYKRSNTRLGIGGNWNACLRHAEAPYVQYLFQDDLWGPSYLALGLAALEQDSSIGLAAIHHRYQYESGVVQAYEDLQTLRKQFMRSGKTEGKEFLRSWLARGMHPNVIGEPSFVMLRKSMVDRVGFFLEDMPQNLDSEYWMRCLLASDLFYEPNEGGAFRVHSAAASARNAESGAGIFDRFRCFERLIAMLPSGQLQKDAIRARNKALEEMVGKFFARLRSGKKVSGGKGGGGLLSFALKHPLLIFLAILRSLSTH